MKKRITILMTTLLLTISVCVGCGAENATTEPTETVTETTTEESSPEQTEEVTATPEETAEPTPEEKEEPSAEMTTETEPETEPTETAEPEQTEASTPEPVPQYTYTDMSATMFAQQTVNVRDLPDTTGSKVGSLSTNDEIAISGQCNETGWYRFEYNGNVTYVSNKYVSENKVEIQQAPADNTTAGTGSVASNWADGYPKNQWIDMDEYFFYIANSQPEANQVCGDYMGSHTTGSDGHLYHTDLNARYPDRKLYTAAWTTQKGNVPIAVVSTEYEDASGYHRPKFIWE